jgi:hypothetical protein
VTNALGFSKRPNIQWNRTEFVLAWDDRRREASVAGDRSGIFGQRISPEGHESAALALSPERIGLAYMVAPSTGMGGGRLGFRVFDASFAAVGVRSEPIGMDVQGPSVQFVGDRFIVLWAVYSPQGSPGASIWGAAYDINGELLVSPRPVTSGANFARFQEALSLGDRLLLAWTDDHDGNFEIYWEVLAPDLSVRNARQRLTFSATDSIYPSLAVGFDGKIGVLFDDYIEGSRQPYFTTLECSADMR